MGRLANLLHSIGVYLVTLVIGSSLCARGLDRDSFESSETRVGLVNQPEYGPLLYSFHYYYCDILVLALVGYFWPNTCGSRPHLVSTMDIGFEELLTKSVIGDRL